MGHETLIDEENKAIGRLWMMRSTKDGSLYGWSISETRVFRVRKRKGEAIGREAALKDAVTAAAILGLGPVRIKAPAERS